jgi:superoxide reductase
MSENRMFFHCKKCGNVEGSIFKTGTMSIACCGEQMELLVPNIADEEEGDHFPFIERSRNNQLEIRIGLPVHPAEEDHYISFVFIDTIYGSQVKRMKTHPCDEPVEPFFTFSFSQDSPKIIYSYCTRHGLWKTVFEDQVNMFSMRYQGSY